MATNDESVTRIHRSSPEPDRRASTAPNAQLVVVEGASRGVVIDLGVQPTTIGRREDNFVVLNSTAVSKYHAQILFENGRYSIQDMQSTNGILVNGVRLENEVLRQLSHGDNILIGDHLLLFRQAGSFTDEKTGMSTISFDVSKVRQEVDDLLKDLPAIRRPSETSS